MPTGLTFQWMVRESHTAHQRISIIVLADPLEIHPGAHVYKKVLTDQVPCVGAHLDLLTSLGSIPVRILRRVQVPILLLALVLFRPEAACKLRKVLFMMAVRASENDKAPVLGAILRQIDNALVQLEAVMSARVLINV